MSVDYARVDYLRNCHWKRYSRHVDIHGLVCQECGGDGGEIEPVLDYGQGPWISCGFCEGTGLVTRWMRGQWLRWKKEAKARGGKW